MTALGRNAPCPCGSRRKAKACCGVERPASPGAVDDRTFLGDQARAWVHHLDGVSNAGVALLLEGVVALAATHPELRVASTPAGERRRESLAATVARHDSPATRASLARRLLALRQQRRVDAATTAAGLFDLTEPSSRLLTACVLLSVEGLFASA